MLPGDDQVLANAEEPAGARWAELKEHLNEPAAELVADTEYQQIVDAVGTYRPEVLYPQYTSQLTVSASYWRLVRAAGSCPRG